MNPAPGGEAESLLLCGKEGIVRVTPSDQGWSKQWLSKHSGDLKGAGEVRYGMFGGGQPYVATIEPMHGNEAVVYVLRHLKVAAEPVRVSLIDTNPEP